MRCSSRATASGLVRTATTLTAGLTAAAWGSFLFCQTAKAGIGADCNGVPYSAVRYDTPTFGGFSVSTSYGEDDIYDVALKYAGDFGNIKVSAAGGYTHSTDERYLGGGGGLAGFKQDVDLYQVGASAMHVPSGLFIYGMYQNEQGSYNPANTGTLGQSVAWRSCRRQHGRLVLEGWYQADLEPARCDRALR